MAAHRPATASGHRQTAKYGRSSGSFLRERPLIGGAMHPLPDAEILGVEFSTLPAISRVANAQAYPTRPITMIVAFAAGGPTDVFGRVLAAC
jgi:hypothetical protein